MQLKINDIITAIISNITDFGAFVEFEDEDSSMIYFKEIPGAKYGEINKVLKIGDTIEALVIKGRKDEPALSITALQKKRKNEELQKNQQNGDIIAAISKPKLNDIVKCSLNKIEEYGAFVSFGLNESGLIHYSEIPDASKGDVEAHLPNGEFEAIIIDLKNGGKYSLSIKKLIENRTKEQVREDLQNLQGEEKTIREIWKIFTDINKCLLQYMQQPILLNPKSSKIDRKNNKITIDVNTEIKFELFEKSFRNRFNTNLIQKSENEWRFFVNVDSISEKTFENFKSECDSLYFNFFPQPFIEGTIKNFISSKKNEIEQRLVDYCPNMIVYRKNSNEIIFRQSYQKHSQAKEWYDFLITMFEEINNGSSFEDEDTGEKKVFEPIAFNYSIEKPNENFDQFLIERNVIDLKEHENIIANSLKGAIFMCGEQEIGKLFKVDYPSITFSVMEENMSVIEKLIADGLLTHVSTDMNGDSEKVNRLRESFDFITENPDQLRNPKLAIYLFDASKATPNAEEKIKERVEIINKNRLNNNLNDSQVEAIAKAVEAKDLALIQGPPGTGKSTAIAELVWQLALADKKKKILLTSEANLAVDNALNRLKYSDHNLVKPIRIGSGDRVSAEGLPYAITELKKWAGISFSDNYIQREDDDAIVNSEEYKYHKPSNVVLARWMSNIFKRSQISDSELRRIWFEYLNDLPQSERVCVYKAYMDGCNLIGATCSSISEKNYLAIENHKKVTESKFLARYKAVFPKQEKINFDIVVQDEASKATPSELSLPLIYGKKSVIIGDHRQLPPNLDREDILYKLHYQLMQEPDIDTQNEIKQLEDFVRYNFDQLEKSHFERLYTQAQDSIKGIFHYQYRMHPDINDVIKQFYVKDGGLECGLTNPIDLGVNDPDFRNNPFSRYHGIDIEGFISPENHVIWIDTKTPEILEGSSRANIGEVKAIEWVLSALSKSDSFKEYNSKLDNDEEKEIGLISFYGAQLKYLKRLQNNYSKSLSIKPSSVDRFQGMERNIVIVSLVRSNCIAEKPNQAPDYRIYKQLGYRSQRDLGFAKSPNRLNVALSRAKRLLIIVGNRDLYSSYINKDGVAIYKNVYECIKNNPNGRIIPWDDGLRKRKPLPISKDRSANLNTRDIKASDSHLRVIETWFNRDQSINNPKIAVLELSTKAVKLLIGKDQNAIKSSPIFSFDNFLRNADKTETGKGLNSQNEMDMTYFQRKVMPVIIKMRNILRQEQVDVVYTVATAAYRTAKNRDEVISYIKEHSGINVRILSKKEESMATLVAYSLSTRYRSELNSSSHIIMIDQGGGSTEVSVFDSMTLSKSYSINLGTTALRNNLFLDAEIDTPIEDAFRKSDQKMKERLNTFYKNMGDVMHANDDTFCVSVGTAITKATGKKNNASQHDSILTKDQIIEKIDFCNEEISSQFSTVGELNSFDFEASKGNKTLDAIITMRLGLPMFVSLMERFNISKIHVSGTGLWYGVYLQRLFNISDIDIE
jgi:superfamily I DNA and/or RNA helicase/predicted RNA-binding protein with RPS1 domain